MERKTSTEKKENSSLSVKEDGIRYTRKQLVESIKYRGLEDILYALLDEDNTYSLKEVDNMINDFAKGKVN